MFVDFIYQNIFWFIIWAVLLNLLIISYVKGGVSGAKQVSVLEMPALQRGNKSIVLDVNKAEHYALAHIPGAINIPLEVLNEENQQLIKNKNKTVILTCQSGGRSQTAARKLVAMGFENVNILNGGIMAWTKENLPTASQKPD